jgi:hypothetical protein
MWREHAGTNRKAFRAIGRLRELRKLERGHLRGFETPEDRDLLYEVGWRQAGSAPLTVKEALLLNLGSIATVQRRLRELRREGLIVQRRSAGDARVQELTLAPKTLALFARCDDLLRDQERWEEAA